MSEENCDAKKVDKVPIRQKIGVGIGGFPFHNGTYAYSIWHSQFIK